MKKLIAAAVATAVIVPATSMAAATLYGKIHMDTSFSDNGTISDLSVNTNSSRIGVKGSEDLGGGLKAVYAMEWGVDMRGSGALSNRHRYVGLAGGFGTVLAGRLSTPAKVIGRKTDLFGDRMGTTRAQNGGTGAVIDIYAPNTLAYVTPSMGGFNATLAYVTDGTGTSADNNDNDAFSGNIVYSNGPVYAGIGYTKLSGGIFGSTTDQSYWRIAGSFKMAGARIVGSYTDISDASGVAGDDSTIWHLGGSYKFGSNTAKIQYVSRGDRNLVAGDDGSDNITVGLDHAFSKRTTAYVSYSHTSNDTNSSDTPWSHGSVGLSTGGTAGTTAKAFTLGMIHKF